MNALREASQSWNSPEGWFYLAPLFRRHLLTLPWTTGVRVLHRDQCRDLPDQLALTEIEMRGPTVNDVRVFVSLDRIEDFIRKYWGEFGVSALRILQNLLIAIHEYPQSKLTETLPGLGYFTSFTFVAGEASLTVAAICPKQEWQDLINLLVWINDVAGQPKSPGFFCPIKRTFPTESSPNIGISIPPGWKSHFQVTAQQLSLQAEALPLYVCSVAEEGLRQPVSNQQSPFNLCWTALVGSAYLGRYTLQLPRYIAATRFGVGLRANFNLVRTMAGTDSVIIHDGGIVLSGFQFALVPVEFVDKGKKTVQWHLLENEGQGLFSGRQFWKRNLPATRLKESNINALNGEAYLGLLESIEISSTVGNGARFCSLDCVRELAITSGRSYLFGVQFALGGHGATGTIQGQRMVQQTVHHLGELFPLPSKTNENWFIETVKALYRGRVVVYDEERKLAWLYWTLDLILLLLL